MSSKTPIKKASMVSARRVDARHGKVAPKSAKTGMPVAELPSVHASGPSQGFDFAKCHVHFAMPCYGGMVNESTMTSFLSFTVAAARVGLSWTLDTMVNEALVTRARNNLCAKMMFNEKATHFMFIDSDISFDADMILGMMAADKDVVGGLYPKKSLPIEYVINLKRGGKIDGPLFEVDTMGTGFLMFRKNVYQRLIDAHPETKYVDDIGLGKQYEPWLYAIYDTVIDERGHYLSEDWTFCRRWQALGGEIWADSRALLNHSGLYQFKSDVSALERRGLRRVDARSPEGQAFLAAQKAAAEGK